MNTLFFKCLVINSMILLALGYKTNFNTNVNKKFFKSIRSSTSLTQGEKQIVDNYIVTAKFTPAQQSSCHSPAIEPLVKAQVVASSDSLSSKTDAVSEYLNQISVADEINLFIKYIPSIIAIYFMEKETCMSWINKKDDILLRQVSLWSLVGQLPAEMNHLLSTTCHFSKHHKSLLEVSTFTALPENSAKWIKDNIVATLTELHHDKKSEITPLLVAMIADIFLKEPDINTWADSDIKKAIVACQTHKHMGEYYKLEEVSAKAGYSTLEIVGIISLVLLILLIILIIVWKFALKK